MAGTPTPSFLVPLEELRRKLLEAERSTSSESRQEAARLREEIEAEAKRVTAGLTPWQQCQLARHPERPFALDFIHGIFTDWVELHGDRAFGDDCAVVTGFARLDGDPVAVIGQQKGRDTRERLHRNFGQMKPEGYRKALRIMKLAEKFGRPVVCLVDTPGAYPGLDAEERGQAQAIAHNLREMASLETPVVVVVIGEGGSGGALGIGVGDVTLMLQYATYSVISPEGCASILWKSADRAPEAAEILGITAPRLKQLGLIDKIVNEPVGGAHRDPAAMIAALKKALADALKSLSELPLDELVERREDRIVSYGKFKELDPG